MYQWKFLQVKNATPLNYLQSWQERMLFQKQVAQYFTDIPKNIAAIVKALSPVEGLHNVYRITGHLVKCCAKCLYVKVSIQVNYTS